ncbi:MAG: M24 family metallopeptidase [Chlamydiales bacterium]
MKRIEEAQKYLKARRIDGWLLYDFHGKNELARHFLHLSPKQMTTRRFFYWIPAFGEPVKLLHAIEPHILDSFPGELRLYSSWQSLEKELAELMQRVNKAAMEYSPKNAIPYISLVDAGTVDLIRSLGVEVVSSADFLPYFTAVLSDEQIETQRRAAKALDQIAETTWNWIGDHLKRGHPISEYDVQQKIVAEFKERHLITDHAPIVAVNAHTADPHYAPEKESSSPIEKGDFILIDLWAKERGERAIFGDITRVAVAAATPTQKQQEIFSIVRKAQKTAAEFVRKRLALQKRVEGWEVDEIARSVIREAGYGIYFIHRTGHNIEIELHGSGAHMDNLEMHDTRPILPSTCFSLEPGIYLPGEFGVRLEFDLLVLKDGTVEISGGEPDAIVCLF